MSLLRALLGLTGNYASATNSVAGHALRDLSATLLGHAQVLGVMVALFIAWAFLQARGQQRDLGTTRR